MDFTTLGLIILCMVILALMIYLIPIIKKWAISKGINIGNTLITTDKILEILQLLMKDSNILPTDQQIFVNNIVEIIQSAIKLTQKLYEDGQCLKEERTDKAIEIVFGMVKITNITITNEQHDVVVKVVKRLMLLLN